MLEICGWSAFNVGVWYVVWYVGVWYFIHQLFIKSQSITSIHRTRIAQFDEDLFLDEYKYYSSKENEDILLEKESTLLLQKWTFLIGSTEVDFVSRNWSYDSGNIDGCPRFHAIVTAVFQKKFYIPFLTISLCLQHLSNLWR